MIKTVLDNAAAEDGYNQIAFVKEYIHRDWSREDIQLATNGPTNLSMSVQSESYPVKAAEIKKSVLHATVGSCFWVPRIGYLHHPTPLQIGARSRS